VGHEKLRFHERFQVDSWLNAPAGVGSNPRTRRNRTSRLRVPAPWEISHTRNRRKTKATTSVGDFSDVQLQVQGQQTAAATVGSVRASAGTQRRPPAVPQMNDPQVTWEMGRTRALPRIPELNFQLDLQLSLHPSPEAANCGWNPPLFLTPEAGPVFCRTRLVSAHVSRELPPSTLLVREIQPTWRAMSPTMLKTARSAARDTY